MIGTMSELHWKEWNPLNLTVPVQIMKWTTMLEILEVFYYRKVKYCLKINICSDPIRIKYLLL